MPVTRPLFVCVAVAFASLLAGSAFAGEAHTWVSSTGSGTTCTRTSPCQRFDTAVAATITGGVISVLNPDDYFSFTIPKSLTVRAEAVDGGSVASPGGGFFITVAAGATDTVTLEGLHFTGVGSVRFDSGGQLHIIKCVFSDGNAIGGGGNAGIRFQPNGASKLSVTDTVVTNQGTGTGGGIVVNPRSGGSAQVALKRVTVNGNAFGIVADGTGSTGGINMTIADSMIANNTNDGILATTPTGGAPIGVLVTNTQSVNNTFGARALGPNVTLRVKNSEFAGNSTGLKFGSGGALLTAGNNLVRANATDGAFSGPVALQ